MLSASFSPSEKLWELFYRETTKVISGEAFSITLYDEETCLATSQRNVDTVNGKIIHEYEGEPYAIHSRHIAQIVESRKGELIRRKQGEQSSRNLECFGDKSKISLSLLFAPMLIGKRMLGVVSVQSYQANAYNQDDLDLLEAIAASGALALENA